MEPQLSDGGNGEIGYAQIDCRNENEIIEASADSFALTRPIPFLCECATRSCTEIVLLTFEEYESVRTSPRRFFNITGHESASVAARAERIVAVTGELTVVEKIGVAGDLAAAAHERA